MHRNPSYGKILTAARLKGLKGHHMETDPNQVHTKSLDAASKPKSGKRKWWRAISIVCIGLSVFILAIPTILGTRWIYEPLIKRLAMDEFDLNIESVQLGWFSQHLNWRVKRRSSHNGLQTVWCHRTGLQNMSQRQRVSQFMCCDQSDRPPSKGQVAGCESRDCILRS